MKVKEESEKAGSNLNIQKTKIIASGSITSWQIDGENVETMTDFIFLGSKIIADGDCSYEIKRCLLLGRKAMTNLVCTHAQLFIMSDSFLSRSKYLNFVTAVTVCRDFGIEEGKICHCFHFLPIYLP